jgi:cellulose synthase (UDP-forming)
VLKTIRLAAWSVSGALALALLMQPVSVEAQLTMASGAIVVMIAVWMLGRGAIARWAFLALGSMVAIRYLFWRATSTLPPLDQPFNFTLGLLLFAAEIYSALILVISLIINADPLARKPLEREADDALPTVDVFIPTYNEDEYILATTVAAAKSMDYPVDKLTVWLLDDGGTDQKVNDANPEKAAAALARRIALKKLCAELGARYLTRQKNEHAKAGNMNNGLKHATAEIIVVFDADHAPFKSFLRETVGHFAKDPKLFLVQTPHVFLNPDPIERNLRTFQAMPSENEMFYSVTQRGLDKWDSSFFCGSAALLRRAALDVAGGFSGITITEDCETALELHAKGWHSVYVDKPLIAGLQPETFESFIGQRSRWCQGMFQILLLKNPLFKKGLKPIQRLSYLSSMTFWFFPLPRLVFTFAPLFHIFFDMKIFVSSMDEAFSYTGTYMVVNLLLQNYLYGRVRWPFVSELYEYVQGVYLAKAIISVVTKPRKPTFNVTSKGISLEENHLSALARPFFAIFTILLVGAVTAFFRYFTQPGAELMLIVGLWTSFNAVIAGAALGVVAERRELNRFPRLAIARQGLLTLGSEAQLISIQSVSAGGCTIHFPENTDPPVGLGERSRASLAVLPLEKSITREPLTINLANATPGDDMRTYSFSFADMTPKSYMTLADVMYGDPEAMVRFVQKRRAQKSLLTGSAQFLMWSLLEPMRALSYLPKAVLPAKTHVAAIPNTPAAKAAPTVSENLISADRLAIPDTLATDIIASPVAGEPLGDAIAPSISADGLIYSDFDILEKELLGTVESETLADVTADWMQALLTLAANEMKRQSGAEERSDAVLSIAS